jgi:5-methylcytosine-specific restriction enzyme A
VKPARICAEPHCINVQPCAQHQRRPWQQNVGRSAAERGYGTAWRRQRRVVLQEEPFCRNCGDTATHVDHIVPKAHGGKTVRANLQPLCTRCHRSKTGRDRLAGGPDFLASGGNGDRSPSVFFERPQFDRFFRACEAALNTTRVPDPEAFDGRR